MNIGITGSYGGMNLGDEAILKAIIAQLRHGLPDVQITVFSRDADDTKRRHAVERVIPVRKLSRAEVVPEVERLDLLVFGGGGILYDAEARVYLREVQIAKERGVPVFVYAIGAGPLKDPVAQGAVREALEGVAGITVREKSARQVLEEAGVHRDVVVTADPALLLKPEPLPRNVLKHEGLEGKRRLVGMSVREPGAAAPDLDERVYHALLANAADFMVDRFDADIVFVPMERSVLDSQHSHAVIAKMLRATRARVLNGEYTSAQLLSLMEHFDFAVGMRLHFLIFAALRGVPFVALPYAGKVGGFLEDLQLPGPPMQLVNPGRLIAHIDDSWDNRRALRATLLKSVPPLQERARETMKILLRVIDEEKKRGAFPKAA
ncbi:MAG TPA: polysaccharide pyruvyl transferase family protein [Burkholderiales bacterium]